MSCGCNNNPTVDGHGYYVLPRFVEAPISINNCGTPQIPRNRWYEFHLNGNGSRDVSDYGSWDDMGQVCLTRMFPKNDCGQVFPVQFCAITAPGDDAIEVKMYGLEILPDGREVEVWRNGSPGWVCNNNNGATSATIDPNTPAFSKVDRITKGSSTEFITLIGAAYKQLGKVQSVEVSGGNTTIVFTTDMAYTVEETNVIRNRPSLQSGDTATSAVVLSVDDTDTITVIGTPAINPNDYVYLGLPAVSAAERLEPTDYGDVYGLWYPDELEPSYRMIKLPYSSAQRIRVLYRKRGKKITSILEPIPLRSKMAMECMFRAMKMVETDPLRASEHEMMAVKYLAEECIKDTPSTFGQIQFDQNLMPTVHGYIM